MGFKLIAQIVLIVAAFVIIFTFILPTFDNIKSSQNELFLYEDAVSKAAEFNQRLRELISVRDSFSSSDLQTIELFVPTSINKVQVMMDIESIFANRDITISSLTAKEEVVPSSIVLEGQDTNIGDTGIVYQDYEILFTATYEQMKEMLMLLEANMTLLEVMELTFDTIVPVDPSAEGAPQEGEYAFTLVVRAYGLNGSEK